MLKCSFLPVFYEHHQRIKSGKPSTDSVDYSRTEEIWLGFYGLGKFETFAYLYSKSRTIEDFHAWLIGLKGEQQVKASAEAFHQWASGGSAHEDTLHPEVLNEQQWQSWKAQGFIRVSGLVDAALCDAVTELICMQLGVDLSDPQTWYPNHPDWHGLMFQLYQDERIIAIKQLPGIAQLFTELYGTRQIIANTEKVSFNPPETAQWKFRHHQLHWDIDFAHPDHAYIQGLVYLNDVPENRGPLTLVPGFHQRFDDWMTTHPDPHEAQEVMRKTLTGTPVPGKKGDLVLWLQTLPHSASSNFSDLPRFVQYISFSKC
jgi:hypothetical protein